MKGVACALLVLCVSIQGFSWHESNIPTITPDSDNSFQNATKVNSGQMITGEVNATDDMRDYYKIFAQSGEVINASLYVMNSSATLLLEIYNGEYNRIASTGSNKQWAGASALAVKDSFYYIRVSAQQGATSYYKLWIYVGVPTTVKDGDKITGYLSNETWERGYWYRIYLKGNVSGMSEMATFNMTAPNTADFDLYFYYIWSKNISWMYSMSWSKDPKESVKGAAMFDGWYYLYVRVYQGNGTYTIDTSVSKIKNDGDNEPQNATKLPHNPTVSASLDQEKDYWDWYAVYLNSGDYLNIRMTIQFQQGHADIFNLSVFYPNKTLAGGMINYQNRQILNYIDIKFNNVPISGYYYIVPSAYFPVGVSGGTYYYTDDEARCSYTLNIKSTNRPPIWVEKIDAVVMDEDTVKVIDLEGKAKDPDNDTVSYEVMSSKNIKCSIDEYTLTLEPMENWFGDEKIVIAAKDKFQGINYTEIEVSVKSVNDPPKIVRGLSNVIMNENSTYDKVDLSTVFTDVDILYGDRLTYSVKDNGSIIVEIEASGRVKLTAPDFFYGEVTMIFTATDNASASASTTLNVTVKHVNHPPEVVIREDNITIKEDGKYRDLDLKKYMMDPDNDPLTVEYSPNPNLIIVVKDDLLTDIMPYPDWYGETAVMFIPKDGSGTSSEEAFILHVIVEGVNDEPKIKEYSPEGDIEISEGDYVELSVDATDIDNDELNYTWYLDNIAIYEGIDVDAITYESNYTSAGKHILKVIVSDGEYEAVHTWNLTVKNVNREPYDVKIVKPKKGKEYEEGSEIEFVAMASDYDIDDVITYKWKIGDKVLSEDKEFTTSLPAGKHKVTLIVSDGHSEVKVSTWVTVKGNEPPVITSINPREGGVYTTDEEIIFSVVVSDRDNDPLEYSWYIDGEKVSDKDSFSMKLAKGRHTITISVFDGKNYVNQSYDIEVESPEIGGVEGQLGMMAVVAGGIVLLIIIIAIISIIMRSRKSVELPPSHPPPSSEPEPPESDVAVSDATTPTTPETPPTEVKTTAPEITPPEITPPEITPPEIYPDVHEQESESPPPPPPTSPIKPPSESTEKEKDERRYKEEK